MSIKKLSVELHSCGYVAAVIWLIASCNNDNMLGCLGSHKILVATMMANNLCVVQLLLCMQGQPQQARLRAADVINVCAQMWVSN